MNDDFIPVIGVLGILFIILGYNAIMRYISYKETMMLAEKGLARPVEAPKKNTKSVLRWGIVLAALGVALSIGLYPIGFSEGDSFPLHLGPWMLGGFIPLFVGLGLVLIHYLAEKE